MSDDGRQALSLIAMLGNVFSPFYFAARARGGGKADPLDFPAMNVALYTPSGNQWVLTERDRGALARRPDELVMGPSCVRWEGSSLVVELEERTAPLGRRLAGTIRLHPEDAPGDTLHLDTNGRHRWGPIAPAARAEVVLTHPSLRFEGAAYLDSNGGDEPLEAAFRGWNWSRLEHGAGAVVTYDVERRDGSRALFTRAFEHGGGVRRDLPVSSVRASPTLWRMPRVLHADPGRTARVERTLEDTPFYSRSLIRTTLAGRPAVGTHESLSLDRFTSRAVQFMLPYRMRREVG